MKQALLASLAFLLAGAAAAQTPDAMRADAGLRQSQ